MLNGWLSTAVMRYIMSIKSHWNRSQMQWYHENKLIIRETCIIRQETFVDNYCRITESVILYKLWSVRRPHYFKKPVARTGTQMSDKFAKVTHSIAFTSTILKIKLKCTLNHKLAPIDVHQPPAGCG